LGLFCEELNPFSPNLTATKPNQKTKRTKVLLRLIRPYTRVRLPFLAAQLNAPLGDVESLLVGLILDGKVDGRIDQVCCVCCEGVYYIGRR
jgi:hypothetical protein